ncbi:MAG: peptidase [Pseudomonadota bacterium]
MGRADPASLARAWLGTPYRHQASCLGAGADCLGLVLGVWRELYDHMPLDLPGYTQDWAEAAGDERMWAAARRHLAPASGPLATGQILLFRMRRGAIAKHLGIVSAVSPARRMIHAYSGHGVVESVLTPPWLRKVVDRFAFP